MIIVIFFRPSQSSNGATQAKKEIHIHDDISYLLDIVVTQSSSILELFSGKNQPLLIRRNPLLVLDFRLHIVDCITRLYFKSNGLTRQGLDEAVLRV